MTTAGSFVKTKGFERRGREFVRKEQVLLI